MLDGLVGGAVLTQTDAVVGGDEDAARVGQAGHAHACPHVVCSTRTLSSRSYPGPCRCMSWTKASR